MIENNPLIDCSLKSNGNDRQDSAVCGTSKTG